jgi:two-component system sensor histidine kinase BaeS
MSLRVRLFAFFAAIALIAITATSYLVYRQTARQAVAEQASEGENSSSVIWQIAQYGRERGTWDRLDGFMNELAARYRLHIDVRSESQATFADTGGQFGFTISVEPPAEDAAFTKDSRSTLLAMGDYRREMTVAACLTRANVPLVTSFQDGIPHAEPLARESERLQFAAAGNSYVPMPTDARVTAAHAECRRTANETDLVTLDEQALARCADAKCRHDAFVTRTAAVRPESVEVTISALADEPLEVPWLVVVAAGAMAALALASPILLSRRILRPVADLTRAARSVCGGDLTARVPTRGRDELAQLATAFNTMADALQRAEENQRRLVADVAHELRSPLVNLRGYLEALRDGVLPPDAALFASLHQEALLQERIVDDLQDLALADAGRLNYERVPIDVFDILAGTRDAYRAAAAEADVDLVLDTPHQVIIHADPDRIRQVVANLVSNAMRVTPAGGTITLTAAVPTQEPNLVRLSVSDTGPGISPDDLPHIFERFWRVDSARTRADGGSGLGLAIAKQIIIDHGGTIAAASTVGVGTTMTIDLPRASLDEKPRLGRRS